MKTILSWLLHHANRNTLYGEDKRIFYEIKNRILAKRGKYLHYDVQFIEGKKCRACGGTGTQYYYDFYGDGPVDADFCWHCYNGWYKRPTWNILSVVDFGGYVFHRPYKRVYENPNITSQVIEGYIEHTPTRFSKLALKTLFVVYDKTFFRRWYKNIGLGWRLYWWLPRNWVNNVFHVLKYGRKSFPVKRLVKRLTPKPKPAFEYSIDDLPF
jgi:hypothetical protein